MDEIHRMLGREHEADLEREARRRDLAAAARPVAPATTTPRLREKISKLSSQVIWSRIGVSRLSSPEGTVRDGR